MRQITFLCQRALNSLENMSIQDLCHLQQMAKEDFAEAFKYLCKAEGEERPVEEYWKRTLNYIKDNPVPFDNEHVHAVTHAQKHFAELEDGNLPKERWEYLVKSFGDSMHLSCQLFMEIQKYINRTAS